MTFELSVKSELAGQQRGGLLQQSAQAGVVLLVTLLNAVLLVGRAGFRQETGLQTGLFLA